VPSTQLRAMGGKCCTDRKDAVIPGKPGQPLLDAAGKPDRKSMAGAYDPKRRALSIGHVGGGDDAEAFDKAFDNNDLKALVKLLKSQQKIEAFEERMHPWAEDPKTVGALAGTQMAILASVAEKDNPNVKEEIREAGAIPPLVEFLKSTEEDRIQTAVVALSFLTSECSGNVVAAYEAGALPLVLKHLTSKIAGMRAAAATTMRNMCVEKEQYRKEFVEHGGIKGLVEQLAADPDPSLNHTDVQLEAVLNLQDVIEHSDESGLILEYAMQAVDAGAEERLKKLLLSEDAEVKGSAEEVLNSLVQAKKAKQGKPVAAA